MALFETFSKRQLRLARSNAADIYQYENLPERLRVQLVHILGDALGRFHHGSYLNESQKYENSLWKLIFDTLTRELGVFNLTARHENPSTQIFNFMLSAKTAEVLDTLELCLRVSDNGVRKDKSNRKYWADDLASPDEVIAETNARLKEHGVGYEYVCGELIRKDDEFVHSQAVKPAIALLTRNGFEGALAEFMSAAKHHREGKEKEAINDALKCFESTIKCIALEQKWPLPANATSSKLVDALFENKLIPDDLQAQFSALRGLLSSGVATIRNRNAGHGQGSQPIVVPPHVAEFALHLTASCVIFMMRALP